MEHGAERVEEARLNVQRSYEESVVQEMLPWLEEHVGRGDHAAKMRRFEEVLAFDSAYAS